MAMMQSLASDDKLPRERLPYATYFTSMVLCMYDNILGPTVLKIWVGKESSLESAEKGVSIFSSLNYVPFC